MHIGGYRTSHDRGGVTLGNEAPVWPLRQIIEPRGLHLPAADGRRARGLEEGVAMLGMASAQAARRQHSETAAPGAGAHG
jgi:hypothetical protein